MIDGSKKRPISALRFIPRHCGVLISMLHSSGWNKNVRRKEKSDCCSLACAHYRSPQALISALYTKPSAFRLFRMFQLLERPAVCKRFRL
jgi:hypothetical protein